MGSGAVSKPLIEWTTEEVANAVSSLGTAYESYSDILLSNGCDGFTIKDLSSEEIIECLNDMGINQLLHRKNICKKLQQLQLESPGEGNQKSNETRPIDFTTTNNGTLTTNGDKETFRVPSEFKIPDEVEWTPRDIMTNMFQIQGISLDPKDIDPAMRKILAALESNSESYTSDGVNSYDVFLSYRVAADADLAEKLYLNLKLAGIHPFLDKKCLVDGMPWREGFLKGLVNSRKFVAIVSTEGLTQVRNPYVDHTHDNVLLEYQTALQISKHINDSSYIIPVFIGEYEGGMLKKFGDYNSAMYPGDLKSQPNPKLAPELVEAIEESDVNKVNKLIAENVDVNTKFEDENNETVLMKAVSCLNYDEKPTKTIVISILDTGVVNIAAETLDGYTVAHYLRNTDFLYYAIANSDCEAIELALRLGVNIDDTGEDGEASILASALQQNCGLDFIRWLVTDKNAHTADVLRVAVEEMEEHDPDEENNKIKAVKMLLEMSESTLSPTWSQDHPNFIKTVTLGGDRDGIDFCLCHGLDVDHIFEDSMESVLLWACKRDDAKYSDRLALISWLINDKHATVPAISTEICSALVAAVARLDKEEPLSKSVVNTLLEAMDKAIVIRRDVCDATDTSIDSALNDMSFVQDAMCDCDRDAVDLVLRLGYTVDKFDEDEGEISLLACAVKFSKDVEFVDWLMKEKRASPSSVLPFVADWIRLEEIELDYDDFDSNAEIKCIQRIAASSDITGYSMQTDVLLNEKIQDEEFLEWLNDAEENDDNENYDAGKHFIKDIFSDVLKQ